MRTVELQVLDELREGPLTVTRLAERLDANQGWISEVVTDLEKQSLVEKRQHVTLTNTYETRLLLDLFDAYDARAILVGKREEILQTLRAEPKTVAELELAGFATSTIYHVLNELQTTGVVEKLDEGAYRITDDTVHEFLRARNEKGRRNTEYVADGERILAVSAQAEGQPTAFSAFTRYGLDYYPTKTYLYRGKQDIGLEEVLIHAVRFAETKKQMGIAAVFYLTHSASLDTSRLWRLANKWECVETWADLLAFVDRRDVKQDELFVPWDEFLDTAHDYGVYPRGKHPSDSLLAGLADLGATLQTETDAYLLGGGNLILRELKDSTKDIDVVVTNRRPLRTLVEALRQEGYEERRDLETVYEQLNPSIVLEKRGFPRWDVFVETVAGNLQLTENMRTRANETHRFDQLNAHLLSLSDIFLFKAITDRDGDLEDAALLARQADIEWRTVMEEIQRQEAHTGRYFSFSVLDTLDRLDDRYDIDVPIHDRLISYCLENALRLSLDEPKTIHDLRDELDFPDHRIYNTLRKLEEHGEITVDRTGTLNSYERAGQ